MKMPKNILANFILLPELKLSDINVTPHGTGIYEVRKQSEFEICPKCASPANTTYDHRTIRIKDTPIRGNGIILRIKKKRYFCKTCNKPFTEPVQGILPRRRTTQRYRKAVVWACHNFSDLKRVKRAYRCSNDFIYKALYEQLDLKNRTNQYPWPKTIGIDEHFFNRKQDFFKRSFVTMIVDYNNRRLKEVVLGKTAGELINSLNYIQGRENVREAVMDLCDPYKYFVKNFFPNAQIVADKFHVLRLLNPAINRYRKGITGDKRNYPIRKLLLRNGKKLNFFEKTALYHWLSDYPLLNELYQFKEALHGFYRIRGYNKAACVLTKITDRMALSTIKEIKTLRYTLIKWRNEILNYFKFRVTNARTEGYNNVAKVIKRRSYGFRVHPG